MTSKRRTYTEEFKRETVRLWEITDKSAATVEAELGITSGLLNKWKVRLKADGKLAFPGRGRVTPEQGCSPKGIRGNPYVAGVGRVAKRVLCLAETTAQPAKDGEPGIAQRI